MINFFTFYKIKMYSIILSMKKVLFFKIFMFLILNGVCFAENSCLDEISLDKYLNDFNVQEYNVKGGERIKRAGISQFQPVENNEFREGDFSFTSKSAQTTDSKYLLEGLEQRSSLNYDKKGIGFSVGTYSSYTQQNASNATRELFFTPKYNYNNHLSVELNNYLDTKGDYFTQELGLKYKPKFLKNGSVGVSGGSKYYKNSTRSDKLKFSTEFYLF